MSDSFQKKYFFIPQVNELEVAEIQYQKLRSFLESQDFSTTEKRIFRLIYEKDGQNYEAEVGKTTTVNQEVVQMIFQLKNADSYLICTPTRGCDFRHFPIITGNSDHSEILEIIEFD
ncbi:MAG TPA: hypothetical protein PKY59_19555 [Pyrinomonadaceae bacterium]|nr:hypothetical protein [Pyrinomonadaceae bacterium]